MSGAGEERARLDRLVRDERLVEAAELALQMGEFGEASRLYERACLFDHAAAAAAQAGDSLAALLFAVQAGDSSRASDLLAAVAGARLALTAAVPTTPANDLLGAAYKLEGRNAPRWAGELYLLAGKPLDAARCFDDAGDAVRAANILEKNQDIVGAGRLLERRLRKAPDDAGAALALGRLLIRFGKREAAVRALQAVPREAPERKPALSLLAPLVAAMGLEVAAQAAREELARLGGDDAPNSLSPPSRAPNSGDAANAGPDSTRAANAATVFFGRYESLKEVARTPTARVVQCKDRVRGAEVAVKLFSPPDGASGRDALARFVREVEVLRAIDHPQVLPLWDFVPEGPAVVTPWMAGGDLATLVAKMRLTPKRAVEIVTAVLAALSAAHRVGVLHRDVKPENVLFDAAGNAQLADFGVAHLGDLSNTATAGVLGSLGYLSPEGARGEPATVRSDVFSTGALLCVLLTGKAPGIQRVTSDVSVAEHAPPSTVHRDLDKRHDALLDRWLANDPALRPAAAADAAKELAALPWTDRLEAVAPTASLPPPSGSRRPSSAAPDARLAPYEGAETATESALGDDEHGQLVVDRHTDRRLRVLPANDAILLRASLFAADDDRTLQPVLRHDPGEGTLWLEEPPLRHATAPLAGERGLDSWILQRFSEALRALHRRGYIHGRIDGAHLHRTETGEPWIRFAPVAPTGASAERDLQDLAAIAHLLRL